LPEFTWSDLTTADPQRQPARLRLNEPVPLSGGLTRRRSRSRTETGRSTSGQSRCSATTRRRLDPAADIMGWTTTPRPPRGTTTPPQNTTPRRPYDGNAAHRRGNAPTRQNSAYHGRTRSRRRRRCCLQRLERRTCSLSTSVAPPLQQGPREVTGRADLDGPLDFGHKPARRCPAIPSAPAPARALSNAENACWNTTSRLRLRAARAPQADARAASNPASKCRSTAPGRAKRATRGADRAGGAAWTVRARRDRSPRRTAQSKALRSGDVSRRAASAGQRGGRDLQAPGGGLGLHARGRTARRS